MLNETSSTIIPLWTLREISHGGQFLFLTAKETKDATIRYIDYVSGIEYGRMIHSPKSVAK